MKRKKDIRRRLLDLLKEDVILVPLPNHDVFLDEDSVMAHNAAIKPFLSGAQCIEASNVARFFEESYVETPEKFQGFWKDLKCLVPPFKSFFIEWEKPFGIHIGLRMGVLFLACPPELAEETARYIMGTNAHSTPKKINEFREKNPKWIYLTFDFVEFQNKDETHISGLRGPYHTGVVSVSEDGALLDMWMSHGAGKAISERESGQLGLASLVAWTALAMLNCDNIDTVEHHAPVPFQRSRERAGKQPLVSYRTIQVNLEKTPRSIAAERLPEVDGEGKVRLHQKRGHMKDYRKGKGLFGKYKGLWYWGPALAGSGDAGVVVTDYEVKP